MNNKMKITPAEGYLIILPSVSESDNVKTLSSGVLRVGGKRSMELTRSIVTCYSEYVSNGSAVYHKLEDVAGEIEVDGTYYYLIHISDIMAHEERERDGDSL